MRKQIGLNRVAVITGGTSGIGKAIADNCIAHGFTTVLVALDNQLNLPNFYQCDVSDEENVKKAIETITKEYNRIDVLVNCAGFGMSGALELTNTAMARKMMDVNFWGTYYMFKHSVAHMPRGGKIINIGSVTALFVPPWRGFYSATKSAVQSLSFGMRMELKHLGIDVCCINPGEVKTNFTKSRVKNFETNERYGDRIKNATLKVDAGEEGRMSPEHVGGIIFKQIKKKKSKPMVIISGKYKLLNAVVGITGIAPVIYFAQKAFGGEKPFIPKTENKTVQTEIQTSKEQESN